MRGFQTRKSVLLLVAPLPPRCSPPASSQTAVAFRGAFSNRLPKVLSSRSGPRTADVPATSRANPIRPTSPTDIAPQTGAGPAAGGSNRCHRVFPMRTCPRIAAGTTTGNTNPPRQVFAMHTCWRTRDVPTANPTNPLHPVDSSRKGGAIAAMKQVHAPSFSTDI